MVVTNQQVANYAISKVGQYLTVNTNPYGSQCVVLIDRASRDLNGKQLSYTNAIDLLARGAGQGYKIHPSTAKPKAGWVHVIRANGHQFGHTGIIVSDSNGLVWDTVETNVDNNWDSLSVGGPARRKVRYIQGNAVIDPVLGVIGWVVGYFEMGQDTPEAKKEAEKPQDNYLEEEDDVFLIKNGKYGLALMAGGKMVGLTDPGTYNSFKVAGLKEVSVSDKDFLSMSKTFKDSDTVVNIEQPQATKETVTVLAGAINVREDAKATAPVLGTVGQGSVLAVSKQVRADGKIWLEIDYGQRKGYIVGTDANGSVYAK